MTNRRFPQYLTQPFMILSYEPDEQCIALVCVILALVMWGWAIVLPFTLPVLYSKMKKKYPRGFFKHLGYMAGVAQFRGYPAFHEKEFIE